MDDRVKGCCAGFYELPLIKSLLGDEWHPGGPALTRRLAGAVLIGRDRHVLDVASGNGNSAKLLAEHFGCRVTGVDYSSDNCAHANAMAARTGLADRIRFVHGDAEDLPFEADSFDVAISECSLCIFPDRAVALQEIRRVLRPGGHLGISDVVVNKSIPESLRDLFGHVLCIGGALSMEGYCEAFSSAGFWSVRSQDASHAIDEMIESIERRARIFDSFIDAESIELQPGWTVSRSTISEARQFVKTGGVGYALVSGRKPRE